jgi:hypothetical protein
MRPELVGAGRPSLARELRTPSFALHDFHTNYVAAARGVLEPGASSAAAKYHNNLMAGLVELGVTGSPDMSWVACSGQPTDPSCALGLGCQTHTFRLLMGRIIHTFLRVFLPAASESTMAGLAAGLISPYVGLMICLEHCFSHRPLGQQLELACPSSAAILAWMREAGLDSSPGISPSYAMVSPWAERAEDEDAAAEVMAWMAGLVEDDPAVAHLVTFLVLLSPPAGAELAAGEARQLRVLRDHLASLLRGHLAGRGVEADRVAELTGLISGLGRLGSIKFDFFYDDPTNPRVEDLSSVDVGPLG